jgi:hypothetical protein
VELLINGVAKTLSVKENGCPLSDFFQLALKAGVEF